MVREIIFRSITASAISIVHKGNLSKECTDSLGISKGTVISAEYCLKTFCHSGLKKKFKKNTKTKHHPSHCLWFGWTFRKKAPEHTSAQPTSPAASRKWRWING